MFGRFVCDLAIEEHQKCKIDINFPKELIVISICEIRYLFQKEALKK